MDLLFPTGDDDRWGVPIEITMQIKNSGSVPCATATLASGLFDIADFDFDRFLSGQMDSEIARQPIGLVTPNGLTHSHITPIAKGRPIGLADGRQSVSLILATSLCYNVHDKQRFTRQVFYVSRITEGGDPKPVIIGGMKEGEIRFISDRSFAD